MPGRDEALTLASSRLHSARTDFVSNAWRFGFMMMFALSAPRATHAGDAALPAPSYLDQEVFDLLAAATRFYGAQRSGDGANWLLDPGTSCYLRDGEAIGVDLSGGWFDAGDHMKSTMTMSHAAYHLLKAYDAFRPEIFPDLYDVRYGPPNGVPDLLDEVSYALDWIAAAHYRPDRLVHTIGGVEYDHDTWSACDVKQYLPVAEGGEERPIDLHSNMQDRVTAKADIASMAAAALALGSIVYRPFDAVRADHYLEKARSLFALGQTRPTLSEGFYFGFSNMQFDDDMMCGAIELYRATGEVGYLEKAKSLADLIADTSPEYTFAHSAEGCWHSFHLADELAHIRSYWDRAIERYQAQMADTTDLPGLIFSGEEWGTLDRALSAAFIAALHHDATGSTESRKLALSQLDYVMGKNPFHRSFIVGLGHQPPQAPHHANAHGHVGWDAFAKGAPHKKAIRGALVGGPTVTDADGISQPGYQDVLNDYVGNEVSILYNDGLVAVAAFALDVGHDGKFWSSEAAGQSDD